MAFGERLDYTTAMTRLLPLVLAALVALTAQAFGAAHGMRWTGETMEICRGGGIAVVPVPGGSDGQVHLCPDAAIAQFTDTATVPTPDVTLALVAWRAPAMAQPPVAPATVAPRHARSPPLF